MIRARATFVLALLMCGIASTISHAAEPSPDDAEFFERDVRPLLIQHCYSCHGELDEPKGGLKLTSREAVLAGGESGPAIVAGQPGESLLISAVRYDGLEMPPEGKKLSDVEIAKLTRWVERGLPWPQSDAQALKRAEQVAIAERVSQARQTLWSLQPVRSPSLPAVKQSSWPRMPLDYFVLSELEKRGLSPSPATDRRTLLRRLSFDLIGLPPTPEEVEALLADDSATAVERVVDRLLASPHYGERWGRHWLDVARYADTKGYVLFQDANFPWSYTYRDYVVRSLNEDLPYDRFVVEQLAADLLPMGEDKRALTALGFLTLGSGFMNNQQDVIDDRIDVVTRGLLGLTVSCARCHDHKFDAIPTQDYYSLYGVFASSVEPLVPPLFEAPPATEAYAAFAKELAERERKLAEYMEGKYQALISGARSRVAEYLLAANELHGKPKTDDFMLLADGADLNPMMTIRYQVFLERRRQTHDAELGIWHALAALPADQFSGRAAETVSQMIAGATPEKPVNPLVAGAFLGKPLKELGDAARIYGELLGGVDALWKAELAAAAEREQSPPPALTDSHVEALRSLLYGPDAPAGIPANQITALELLPDRPAQGERNKLLGEIEQWRASGPAAPPRAMSLEELPRPIEPHVFVRGNPNNRGDGVPRRGPRLLCDGEPRPFEQGSGRLELARSIADRDNPLTARVLVNRVWQLHFGRPLVATPSDFGARSDPPTHPELLDHLALGFMEHGWSLKWLHRQIVLSATYAQASDNRPQCAAIDPENVWLGRMNRQRLDFETTRDALLAVSGALDRSLGGPPIKNIAEPVATRRTLYGFIDRLNLPGLFRTFDFPSPDATSPQRSQTTVPQQALFFLNSPVVIEAAKRLLARPELANEGEPAAKVKRMYLLSFGRPPTADELQWAQAYLGEAADPAVAWTELAQALLVSNEFVFVD